MINRDQSSHDPWNINLEYLSGIDRLRTLYIESRLNHDFDAMFEALEQLEIEVSVEVPASKKPRLSSIRTEIYWLYDNKDRWCNRDKGGKITHTHPANKRKILQKFNEAYRELLDLSADTGLLVRRFNKNPGRAILDQ